MSRNRTIASLRRRAGMISRAYKINLVIEAKYGQPCALLGEGPLGLIKWHEVLSPRRTGLMFDALDAFQAGLDAAQTRDSLKPAYAVIEVSGGVATVERMSEHAVVTIIDRDDLDDGGKPTARAIGFDGHALADRHRAHETIRSLRGDRSLEGLITRTDPGDSSGG